MANTFTSDPNCVALWRFEDGALTADSVGDNTWTAVGPPTANTSTFKEGLSSAAVPENTYFKLLDADLDAGFPMKNGDTTKVLGITGWVYFDGLYSPEHAILCKTEDWEHLSAKKSFWWGIQPNSGSWYFRLYIGYNSGNSWELVEFPTAVQTGRWYHFGVTFQDSTKAYRIRIWDDTAQALLGGAELTGTATNNINVEDAPLWIGFMNGGGYNSVNGNVDELAVFGEFLTAEKIDDIRSATYGLGSIATWPLSLYPKRYDYPQGLPVDPTIKDATIEGKRMYRSGYQPLYRNWSFILRHLSAELKETLEAFQETVGIGVEPFYWTDVRPVSGSGAGGGSGGTYTVQLAQPLIFNLDDDGFTYRCDVTFNEYCGAE